MKFPKNKFARFALNVVIIVLWLAFWTQDTPELEYEILVDNFVDYMQDLLNIAQPLFNRMSFSIGLIIIMYVPLVWITKAMWFPKQREED